MNQRSSRAVGSLQRRDHHDVRHGELLRRRRAPGRARRARRRGNHPPRALSRSVLRCTSARASCSPSRSRTRGSGRPQRPSRSRHDRLPSRLARSRRAAAVSHERTAAAPAGSGSPLLVLLYWVLSTPIVAIGLRRSVHAESASSHVEGGRARRDGDRAARRGHGHVPLARRLVRRADARWIAARARSGAAAPRAGRRADYRDRRPRSDRSIRKPG